MVVVGWEGLVVVGEGWVEGAWVGGLAVWEEVGRVMVG
jgi:hypothetical protein